MLMKHLSTNNQNLIKKHIPAFKLYSLGRHPFTRKALDKNISSYVNSELVFNHQKLFIDMYLALSVATLENHSSVFHGDNDLAFDRVMSGHESLIHNILNDNYGLRPIRQLLIGKGHADLYIPQLHFCIEPSSNKYQSSARRANTERNTDWWRVTRMNNLFTWWTEDYRRTKIDVESTMKNLALTYKRQTDEEVSTNFYIMGVHTVPFFVPYNEFVSILKSNISPESVAPY